jgi:hypothetical protein
MKVPRATTSGAPRSHRTWVRCLARWRVHPSTCCSAVRHSLSCLPEVDWPVGARSRLGPGDRAGSGVAWPGPWLPSVGRPALRTDPCISSSRRRHVLEPEATSTDTTPTPSQLRHQHAAGHASLPSGWGTQAPPCELRLGPCANATGCPRCRLWPEVDPPQVASWHAENRLAPHRRPRKVKEVPQRAHDLAASRGTACWLGAPTRSTHRPNWSRRCAARRATRCRLRSAPPGEGRGRR